MKTKYLIYINIYFIFCLEGLLYSQPVTKHGQLWVDGAKLKDKTGAVVVLKGMSLGWHNWWYRFYDPATVKWLVQDWGCSVIRIALGVEPDSGYIKQPKWSKEILESVVGAAIKENIYVIIDWHSHNINLIEAKSFFTEMAKRYGEYPNVIYEIFNEPDDESWNDIKAYSTEIISTIRKIDRDNVILVGTPNWAQNVDIAADDPINGYKNIMYTLHFYAASQTQWLRNKVNYAIEKGLPIFVSECSGSHADGNGEFDFSQMKKWIDLLDKKQISWVMWSVSDKNETSSILKPGASSYGAWTEDDLSDSGKFARSLLRNYSFGKYFYISFIVYLSLFILFCWWFVRHLIFKIKKRAINSN